MSDITQVLDQLLDSKFVKTFIREHGFPDVRDQIPRRVLLNESQLAEVAPLLKPLPDHAHIGLVGSYRQRLLICSNEFPPDPSSDEGSVSFEGVNFTFGKTPIPKHEWEWDVAGSRQWLDGHHSNATKKELGYAAVSAYETICKNGRVTSGELDKIIECARSKYEISWQFGTKYLRQLASNNHIAREAIFDMAKDRKAPVRMRTVRMLSYNLPKSFCLKLLRLHFMDRSKLVRDSAVYRTQVLHLTELTDDLKALRETETVTDIRTTLNMTIGMFERGYFYNREAGQLWIACRGSIKAQGNRTSFLSFWLDDCVKWFPVKGCNRMASFLAV